MPWKQHASGWCSGGIKIGDPAPGAVPFFDGTEWQGKSLPEIIDETARPLKADRLHGDPGCGIVGWDDVQDKFINVELTGQRGVKVTPNGCGGRVVELDLPDACGLVALTDQDDLVFRELIGGSGIVVSSGEGCGSNPTISLGTALGWWRQTNHNTIVKNTAKWLFSNEGYPNNQPGYTNLSTTVHTSLLSGSDAIDGADYHGVEVSRTGTYRFAANMLTFMKPTSGSPPTKTAGDYIDVGVVQLVGSVDEDSPLIFVALWRRPHQSSRELLGVRAYRAAANTTTEVRIDQVLALAADDKVQIGILVSNDVDCMILAGSSYSIHQLR